MGTHMLDLITIFFIFFTYSVALPSLLSLIGRLLDLLSHDGSLFEFSLAHPSNKLILAELSLATRTRLQICLVSISVSQIILPCANILKPAWNIQCTLAILLTTCEISYVNSTVSPFFFTFT
jgi:hypothetical protein